MKVWGPDSSCGISLGLPFLSTLPPQHCSLKFSENLCDLTKICSSESGELKMRVLCKTFCREKEEDVDEKE